MSLLMVPAITFAGPSRITADVASQIINGCVSHAKGKGQSHAIAVYDEGGHPVALLRIDGNQPGVTDFAVQKAAAVASWHFSTAEMAASARQTPGFASAPHVVLSTAQALAITGHHPEVATRRSDPGRSATVALRPTPVV